MVSTQQKTRGEVGVKTWQKAILYVANEVMRVWLIILQQRGLTNAHLLEKRETISNGLFTWLITQHLERAVLELHQDGSNEATERWDLVFVYADPNKEDISSEQEADAVWKTYLDELAELMRKLDALPPGTIYRVVVSLKDEVERMPPPDVPGWRETTFRSVDHLSKHTCGEHIIRAGGKISVNMEYWGKLP